MSVSERQKQIECEPWTGPKRHYDILKEGVIATVVVAILTVALAAFFGSPDEPALTFKGWATASPANFITTTVAELAGTSDSAQYGGPYNTNGEGQTLGPVSPAKIVGVHDAVDSANDFVITPLSNQAQSEQVLAALDQWNKATADQRAKWAGTLEAALNDPAGANGDPTKLTPGDFGPTTYLAAGLYGMAKSGALDGILPAPGQFFNTNNTKQLLFMGDGSYLDDAVTAFNLQGNTWGMVNEPGNYPGQQWLIPFSFWYQLPWFNSEAESGITATLTANGDLYVILSIAVVMALLTFVPFIPGLRSLPRLVPLHKLIWRSYYRRGKKQA